MAWPNLVDLGEDVFGAEHVGGDCASHSGSYAKRPLLPSLVGVRAHGHYQHDGYLRGGLLGQRKQESVHAAGRRLHLCHCCGLLGVCHHAAGVQFGHGLGVVQPVATVHVPAVGRHCGVYGAALSGLLDGGGGGVGAPRRARKLGAGRKATQLSDQSGGRGGQAPAPWDARHGPISIMGRQLSEDKSDVRLQRSVARPARQPGRDAVRLGVPVHHLHLQNRLPPKVARRTYYQGGFHVLHAHRCAVLELVDHHRSGCGDGERCVW
mmetsp:Transcript_16542/g.31706  ORF Transcript_16542/g.31706 Transcript_16542/m.31706 type:complete len:265 (-) Transcript_16542:479-1273(-)